MEPVVAVDLEVAGPGIEPPDEAEYEHGPEPVGEQRPGHASLAGGVEGDEPEAEAERSQQGQPDSARERPPVVGGLRAPRQRHADDRQGDPAQRECRRAFSDGDPVDGGNQRCGGRQGGDDAHRLAREAAVEGPQAGEVQNPRQRRPPEGCARRRRLAGESHHRQGDHEPDRLREQQRGGQGEGCGS